MQHPLDLILSLIKNCLLERKLDLEMFYTIAYDLIMLAKYSCKIQEIMLAR